MTNIFSKEKGLKLGDNLARTSKIFTGKKTQFSEQSAFQMTFEQISLNKKGK